MKSLKYSKDQQHFFDKCLDRKNIFLTGKAGTGKSFIVKEVIKRMTKDKKNIIAIAPTGIAANNIGGQTIHSMFALSIDGVLTFKECRFVNSAKRQLLKKVDTIFIDEISMLRPDILDAMNWTLIKNGLGKLSDKQIIFVGDLKQLPAPIDDNTMSVLLDKYNGFEFHHAIIYNELNVEKIELKLIQRQSDPDFIDALNIVRDGGKSKYFKSFVQSESKGVILAPHNSTVSDYNKKGLESIDGELHIYEAEIIGNAKAYEFNFVQNLQLKDGAKIMYLVNSKENPLFNGTLGIFRMSGKQPFIEVDGNKWLLKEVKVVKKEYVFNDEKNEIELIEIGGMSQLPVKLAYALTIHKSQGLTFDEITVDLTRRCFAKGQLYTALSRVKSPEGLVIKI